MAQRRGGRARSMSLHIRLIIRVEREVMVHYGSKKMVCNGLKKGLFSIVPHCSKLVCRLLEAGFFGVTGAGASVAVTRRVETILEREHYGSSGREVLLDKLHGIVIHLGIIA